MSKNSIAWVRKSDLKRSKLRSGYKIHYEIKLTNICNTCLLGHFTCHPTWLDGGQVKVRSNNVKLLNQCFCIEVHVSNPEFPQDFKHVIGLILRCVELPEIASPEMAYLFLLYSAIKLPKQICSCFVWHVWSPHLFFWHIFFLSIWILLAIFLKIVFYFH